MRMRVRTDFMRHLLVRAREDGETLAVAAAGGQGLNHEAELLPIMQELVGRRVVQRRCGQPRAVLAAPQFVRAGEVIERAVTFSLREPQEAERAMGVVVPRIDGTGAAHSVN